MNVPQLVAPAFKGVEKVGDAVKRYAKLERVLALVCLFIPLFLIWFDGGPVRDSISAYYNMTAPQYFYVPLTVAAMLFAVNGFVKDKAVYNTILGAMLAGVVLFNHHDFPMLHGFFAFAFFGGNAYVIVRYSSKIQRPIKVIGRHYRCGDGERLLPRCSHTLLGGVVVAADHRAPLHPRSRRHLRLTRGDPS